MTAKLVFKDSEGLDIEITSGTVTQDSRLASLVYLCLFTDVRADDADELPDGSSDRRGWPGDTYLDTPWGSKYWLLKRQKLTNDVRLKAIDYATDAIQKLVDAKYAKSVSVTGSIPQLNTLVLSIEITKPDGTNLPMTITDRWENQRGL